MKRCNFLKLTAVTLGMVLVLFSGGCTQDENDDFIPQPANQSGAGGFAVTPSGGTIKALGGDAILYFPAGAVTTLTRFTFAVIYDSPGSGKSISNLAMNAILIEPYMVFNKPVQVSLKYNGCLCNGTTINGSMDLEVNLWKNEVNFLKNVAPSACVSCYMVPNQKIICMNICQTGVVAVGFE